TANVEMVQEFQYLDSVPIHFHYMLHHINAETACGMKPRSAACSRVSISPPVSGNSGATRARSCFNRCSTAANRPLWKPCLKTRQLPCLESRRTDGEQFEVA